MKIAIEKFWCVKYYKAQPYNMEHTLCVWNGLSLKRTEVKQTNYVFYFYSKHHYRYITRITLHTYIIFKSNYYTWGGRDKVNANFHNNSNFEKCLSPLPFFPFHFHPILSIASFTPLLYLYISFPKGWKRIYGIEKTKVQSENEMRAQPSFSCSSVCVCV